MDQQWHEQLSKIKQTLGSWRRTQEIRANSGSSDLGMVIMLESIVELVEKLAQQKED